jgi:hypothetical protein
MIIPRDAYCLCSRLDNQRGWFFASSIQLGDPVNCLTLVDAFLQMSLINFDIGGS